MDDEKASSQNEAPKPIAEAGKDQGEMKEVDTKAQEEAAKEREESGGYNETGNEALMHLAGPE